MPRSDAKIVAIDKEGFAFSETFLGERKEKQFLFWMDNYLYLQGIKSVSFVINMRFMIKSKFSNYIIFRFVICIFVLSVWGILLFLIENDHSNIAIKEDSLTSSIFYSEGEFVCLFALLIYFFLKKFIIITIDSENKTIQFKNAITRYTKQYDFDYFDGYLYSFTKMSGFHNKVLFLVKNKKSWKRINEYYYSNVDEMQIALSSMNYFGFQENIFRLNRRIILNKEIID